MSVTGATERQGAGDPAPKPTREDLDACAGAAMARLHAFIDRAEQDSTDPRLVVEAIHLGQHLEELRGALSDYTATGFLVDIQRDALIAEGERRAAERLAAIPVPRKHAHRRTPVKDQLERGLHVVRGAAIPAAVVAVLHRSWWAHHAAAAIATGTGAVVLTGSVIAASQGGSVRLPFDASTLRPPAQGLAGASPIAVTQVPVFARAVVHPTVRNSSGKGAVTVNVASPLLLPLLPSPSAAASASSPAASSSPAPSQSQQQQQQAGSLVVHGDTIDLTTAASGVVRVEAWGGDVTWSIALIPSELTITDPSGEPVVPGEVYTLSSGSSITLTVTAVPDGQQEDTFAINGHTVTVDLPLPPAPSSSPTPAAPAASDPVSATPDPSGT